MLFEQLEKLTGNYRHFAYICKFDRENKTLGKEKLFLTNREPVFAQEDVKNFFVSISAELEAIKKYGIEEIPLFISYDSVSEFYPVKRLMRSDWPMAAAIIPDVEMRDSYRRNTDSSLRKRSEPGVRDPEVARKIQELRDRVISGELLQVVFSERFEIQDLDPLALLHYFMKGDSSLYTYYYKMGDYEVVGSSPENIISRNGRDLEVHPIAGTIRRGSDNAEDEELARTLLEDPKELREHRMLVDLARNDLGVVSESGSVRVVNSMEIQKFASVQHIVSTVQSRLKEGLGNYDVVKSVFPAGTVSGAPKIRAITLINQYEDVPRGPYAGGLGTMAKEGIDLALLIRSAYRSRESAFTQAGGGIVMDSVPEKEVMEHYSKAETVMGGVRSASIDH